jgi:hypothetical protein
MVYQAQINYIAQQKYEISDRCQRGDSLSNIGLAFDRLSSLIHRY